MTPVFVSIDPDRDTPGALLWPATRRTCIRNLSHRLAEKVRSRRSPACTTFGAKRDAADEVHLMDHSTLTHLMVPGTGVVDFFRREITSDQMAESVACFVGAGKAAT